MVTEMDADSRFWRSLLDAFGSMTSDHGAEVRIPLNCIRLAIRVFPRPNPRDSGFDLGNDSKHLIRKRAERVTELAGRGLAILVPGQVEHEDVLVGRDGLVYGLDVPIASTPIRVVHPARVDLLIGQDDHPVMATVKVLEHPERVRAPIEVVPLLTPAGQLTQHVRALANP